MKIISGTGILIVFIFISTIFSCSNKIIKNDQKNNNTINNSKKEADHLDEKYLTEGFISNNIFRIVIVSDKEDSNINLMEIESKAKKRALATVQKFLISKNMVIDQNVTAKLLNLINQYGNLTRNYNECSKKNNLFYFDIRKDDLKKYVKNISSVR